jgi:hypothetical protein
VEFELEVGCMLDGVVVVEFAIGKGALLLLDERGDDDVDDVNDVDDEVVFWADEVVFWVEVVVFLAEDVMVLGELDELEETMVEEPVRTGGGCGVTHSERSTASAGARARLCGTHRSWASGNSTAIPHGEKSGT